MAYNLTYDGLVTQITDYAERTDATFIAQIPRLIALAENRIAAEARGLGLQNVITDNLVSGTSYLTKPARWRETTSFQIGTGTLSNTRVFLLQRPYEFCRAYWPDATVTDQPKYYGDWDYQHWLLVGTPDANYPYEIIYHERPLPLDDANQTNWTTQYAPQLILYATLLEAQPFLKRDDRVQVFNAEYERALKQTEFEQKRRLMDRTMSVTNA